MGVLFTGGSQERVPDPAAEHDVLFQHHELAELFVRNRRLRYVDHDQQTHRQLILRQTLSVKSPAPAGLFFGCSVASLDHSQLIQRISIGLWLVRTGLFVQGIPVAGAVQT